jgi:uncharacterized protein (UPF0332 family)
MNFEKLLAEGKIHTFRATPEEIKNTFKLAERDLKTAEKNLPGDSDWAFSITYNAILQASRAFMFNSGYRPASFEAHKTILQFMKLALGQPFEETISYFDRKRKKRHTAVYGQVGIVSEKEAHEFLKIAKNYVTEIRTRLKL